MNVASISIAPAVAVILTSFAALILISPTVADGTDNPPDAKPIPFVELILISPPDFISVSPPVVTLNRAPAVNAILAPASKFIAPVLDSILTPPKPAEGEINPMCNPTLLFKTSGTPGNALLPKITVLDIPPTSTL